MGSESKSRTQYSVINIGVGYVGYILNTIAGFICRIVFTKTLPADYLGLKGLFGDIFTMLSLAELGIGTAICYALYKPLANDEKDKITALMQFYGKAYKAIGCVVAVVGVAIMPFLNVIIKEKPSIDESLYLLYAINIFNTVLTYFFSYRSTILSASQQNYYVVGLNYIITIAQSIIQIGFLYLTHNYLVYLIIQSIGTFIYNIAISEIAKKKFPCIKAKEKILLPPEEKKDLIKNIKALVVTKVSEVFVYGIDNVVITYFNSLRLTGQASNYSSLSGMLASFAGQMFNSIIGSVGNLNAVESKDNQKRFFYILNMANFWIFGWVAVGFFVVSNDVVELLYGPHYVLNMSIPFILAVNYYIVSMQSSVTTYRSTLGLFYYGRYIVIFTAILNIIFSIIFENLWGLFGVYLATAAARLLTNTWYMPYSVFKYGFKESSLPYWIVYIKYLIIEIITGAICWFVCSLININPLVNSILKIIIVSAIVNIVYWIFLHRRDEYKYLKGKVIEILKKWFSKIKKAN